MQYNDIDDLVHCHRCKKTMDSIGVYATLNNIDYKEAIKILAIRFKIEVSEYSKDYLTTKKDIDDLFIDFIKKCQRNLLLSKYYEDIKKRRGFTDDIMRMFKIGLFDDSTREWLENTYPTKLLKRAGFINKKNHFIFAKRIVYPYLDQSNNPKYFIYRKIEKEPDFAKNKYSKQIKTDFVKEIPFGLNSLALYRKKPLIITEGITDAISVIMAGYPCLSPVTVQIKKSDIEKMVNHCKRAKKIVVINDNEKGKLNKSGELDNSGLKGAIVTLKVLIPYDLESYISIIPKADGVEKVDLDEYLQPPEDAPKKMKELIDNAIPNIDFLIDPKNGESTKEILELIQGLTPIKKENIINKLNKVRGIGKRTINAEMKIVEETKAKRLKRETEKKLKEAGLQLSSQKNTIKLNDGKNSVAILKKGGIWKQTPRAFVNKILKPDEVEIFTAKLLINKISIDNRHGSVKTYYSFYVNDQYHRNVEWKEFKRDFDIHIQKSVGSGYDNIQKYIVEMSKKVKKYRPEYTLGWENGWKLPQLEEENGYNIITPDNIQEDTYNKVKDAIKEYTKEEKYEIRKKLARFLDLTQTDEVKLAIIIGWCMAAPFKRAMLNRFNLFPHLYLYGLHNTGKSSLAKFFVSKWYKIVDPLSSYTIQSDAQLGIQLSSCTFPLFVSEITEIKNLRVLSTLKDTATGITDHSRLKSDGSLRIKKEKTAGICFDSNYVPREMSDSAFNTKIVFLKFDLRDVIKNDEEWIRLARLIGREKLFSFMYDFTKDWTDKNINSRLDIIIQKDKEDREIVDRFFPRLVNIYHIIKFGLNLFEDMFNVTMDIDKNELLELLKSERKEAVKPLKDWFYEFLLIAINFEADYTEDISTKDGGSYQRVMRGNNPKYLTVPLIEKKDIYLFTTKNLRDFKEFSGKRNLSLNALANNLRQSIGEKELIVTGSKSHEGKSLFGIKIRKEFLD